jgi:hypothetical protein
VEVKKRMNANLQMKNSEVYLKTFFHRFGVLSNAMKSTVLYHYYGPERRNGLCRSFNTKHFALTSAVYTLVRNCIFEEFRSSTSYLHFSAFLFAQNISILVVLLYSWQINVNAKKFQVLGDIYYGVQISYYAIIGSQLSIVFLSIVLIAGINSVSLPFPHAIFIAFV